MNTPVTENELIERSEAPRVTKEGLLANIKECDFYLHPNSQLMICILTLNNGFTVTGQSACADPANFKRDIGERLAREDAEKKIWAFMGYMLKEEIYRSNKNETFFDRLKTEHSELQDKIIKLLAFINGNVQFEKLSQANKDLLIQQLNSMETYLYILAVRISLINEGK